MIQTEAQIQMYVVAQSHRAGLLFHADGNGNFVHGSVAGRKKLLGSRAGWPDMVYILPGRVVWIELKALRGYLNQEQREVHARMRGLGCEVHVVRAASGVEAWDKIAEVLGVDISEGD